MATLITSKRVSAGQRDSVVRMFVDAFRKALEPEVDQVIEAETLNTTNLQRVLAQGGTAVKPVVAMVKTMFAELAENIVGFLKLISGADKITIEATKGKGTIARADKVFTWIDDDFKNYGTDVRGEPTVATAVQVFEMTKDGTFAQIFGGFGENLDRLCLSQDQIVSFCRDQANWLRTDGYGTFFLFKVKGEYFVAYVRRSVGGLGVYAFRLSFDFVWSAGCRHRVVVPQL